MNVISLGAGVQSTALFLMAEHGEITPRPDFAIFADTQWEPKAVYQHLQWLKSIATIPIHVVTAGNIRDRIRDRSNTTGGRFAVVPWHMLKANGDRALGRRQCTKEYKIRPIQREIRNRLGGTPANGCTLWIGISQDEAIRMKPSQVKYIVNRWPLIEREMNRWDCLKWMFANGYPEPPKSSCIGCPFHDDRQWRVLRDQSPDEWQDAIEIDAVIRNQPRFRGQQFMHRSLRPLGEVDLSTPEDHGQLNLFNNECEGMCGV